MNAKDAAKMAEKVREDRAAAKKKREDIATRKAAIAWRKDRADFLVEFNKDVGELIEKAVKDGKKHVDVEYLAKIGSADNAMLAEQWYETSALRDLVEKVFASFRGKGFSIKPKVFSHEHYANYETSDEMYNTYSRGVVISW